MDYMFGELNKKVALMEGKSEEEAEKAKAEYQEKQAQMMQKHLQIRKIAVVTTASLWLGYMVISWLRGL